MYILYFLLGDMTENEGQLDGSGDHSVNDPQPSGIDSLTDSTVITESTVIIEGPDVSDDEGRLIKYRLQIKVVFLNSYKKNIIRIVIFENKL